MGVVKLVPWLLGEGTVAAMAIVTNPPIYERSPKVCLSQDPLYICMYVCMYVCSNLHLVIIFKIYFSVLYSNGASVLWDSRVSFRFLAWQAGIFQNFWQFQKKNN
jgi:hypothetical protein